MGGPPRRRPAPRHLRHRPLSPDARRRHRRRGRLGLPSAQGACSGRFFAFHIHEGSACRGSATDPFSAAGSHFNPAGCPHPFHAGDLPPLLGCDGDALSVFLTNRFRVDEVVGRTVIIHDQPDDFTTQPAGNAGSRIACGVIERFSISQQPQF
ncbi:MAG: superoxide dismutase family protein [Acutalibacteraceae bacterium]